jgi:hypothetical protein
MLDSDNEEFDQGIFQGNFNATFFMNPPPEFEPKSLSFKLSWARFFVDSNGHEYIQWFTSDTKQNTKFNSITNLNGTFKEFIPLSEFSRTHDNRYNMYDPLVWFNENISRDTTLKIKPNNQLNTGSFSVQRMHYLYDIGYEITNGNEIINIADKEKRNETLVVSILSYTEGQVTLFLPKHFVNPTGCESEFQVRVNDVYYQSIENSTINDIDENILEIQIPFSEITNRLLVISPTSKNIQTCNTITDDSDTKKLLPPKKQTNDGVKIKNVICKPGYELILKGQFNYSFCVKPSSYEKLIERGWEYPEFTINNSHQIKSDIQHKKGWFYHFSEKYQDLDVDIYREYLEKFYQDKEIKLFDMRYYKGGGSTQLGDICNEKSYRYHVFDVLISKSDILKLKNLEKPDHFESAEKCRMGTS